MHYEQVIKRIYTILSLLPILLAISLYTLYLRLHRPGEYEASIFGVQDSTVTLHYQLTSLLNYVTLYSSICLIGSTIALLGYYYIGRMSMGDSKKEARLVISQGNKPLNFDNHLSCIFRK